MPSIDLIWMFAWRYSKNVYEESVSSLSLSDNFPQLDQLNTRQTSYLVRWKETRATLFYFPWQWQISIDEDKLREGKKKRDLQCEINMTDGGNYDDLKHAVRSPQVLYNHKTWSSSRFVQVSIRTSMISSRCKQLKPIIESIRLFAWISRKENKQ